MPDFGLFKPRNNTFVAGGPTGLTSWFVVSTDPSGVVVKPAGTLAFHRDGMQGWVNVDGTATGWIVLGALGTDGGWFYDQKQLFAQYSAIDVRNAHYSKMGAVPFIWNSIDVLTNFIGHDSGLADGAIYVSNSNIAFATPVILPAGDVTARSWAIAVDAVLPVPVVGTSSRLGVASSDFAQNIMVHSLFATNPTNWVLSVVNGAGNDTIVGAVCDGLRHTYVVAWEHVAARLTVLQDGVAIISTIALTHQPTVPVSIGVCSDPPGLSIYQLAWVVG
jgi:hypothetical protein